VRENPILPCIIELRGPERRVVVTRTDRGPLVVSVGMFRRGRGILEGESEEVDVFGKRRRALLRRILHELGARGAPNSIRVPLRKLRETSFANGVST